MFFSRIFLKKIFHFVKEFVYVESYLKPIKKILDDLQNDDTIYYLFFSPNLIRCLIFSLRVTFFNRDGFVGSPSLCGNSVGNASVAKNAVGNSFKGLSLELGQSIWPCKTCWFIECFSCCWLLFIGRKLEVSTFVL